MSSAESEGSAPMDPRWVGLLDANIDGWFRQEAGELFTGFPIAESDDVLDVGCGEGPSTLFCADKGAHVTFTDVDAHLVQEVEGKLAAQGRARGYRGVVSDSDPLLVEDASASRIICREVLEHVADPAQVMGELVRAGKPGALYLLTVPGEQGEKIQQHFAPAEYFQHPNHIRIFSKQTFTDLVESAGLVIESYTSNGFFWVFWMSMHWIVETNGGESGESTNDAIHATIKPPFHENMHRWASLWHDLIKTPQGLAFKKQLDALIPKNQVIVARKP